MGIITFWYKEIFWIKCYYYSYDILIYFCLQCFVLEFLYQNMKWSYYICVTNSVIPNLYEHFGHFSVSTLEECLLLLDVNCYYWKWDSECLIKSSNSLNKAPQIGHFSGYETSPDEISEGNLLENLLIYYYKLL